MKLIMENWRQFIDATDKELLEEGFKEWILPVLMAAGIMVGSPGGAEASPGQKDVKSTVQRIIVQGGMTQKQKNKLLQMPGSVKLMLKSLNGMHQVDYKTTSGSLARSVRDMEMRLIGMKPADWPIGHIITMQELTDFLATGKVPDKATMSSVFDEEPEKEKSFSDKLDDFSYDVGQGIRKGLKWVDRSSPVGQNTGWFDDDKAPKR